MNECPNCGHGDVAIYCPQCGQSQKLSRLSIAAVFQLAFRSVFDADRGVLRTFKELTLRPGPMVAAYVGGQRKSYLNPITYFFIVATFQLIDLLLLGDTLREILEGAYVQLQASQGLTATAEEIEAWVSHRYEVMTSFGVYMMLVGVCIPYALFLRAAFFKCGYNLAECFVFAVFTTSHGMLLSSLVAPITVQFGFNVYSIVVLGIFFGMAVYAGGRFFRRWYGYVVTPVLFMVAYFINAGLMDLLDSTLKELGF